MLAFPPFRQSPDAQGGYPCGCLGALLCLLKKCSGAAGIAATPEPTALKPDPNKDQWRCTAFETVVLTVV